MATENLDLGSLSMVVMNNTGGVLTDAQINALTRAKEGMANLAKQFEGVDVPSGGIAVNYVN